MTKMELVTGVSKRTGMTRKQAMEAVDALFEVITEALAKGDKVQIVGFGAFEVRERAARKGRNPQNPKQVIDIPAKKVPSFKPGKLLKERVEMGEGGKKKKG